VRRVLILISAFMFLELFFFAVLSPLLPGLKHELGLSTSQAGVLVAMYALGALVGAIPATLVALRAGVKATAITSLLAFAAMSVAFGLARSYEALLAARFAQGVAGAALWTAAMVWLLEAAPAARRGEMLGFAFGVSEAGAVAGPAIGGVAAGAGRAGTFVAIAVLCAALALIAVRAKAPGTPADRRLELGSMLSSASVRTAMGIAVLPAVLLAAISVLAPLQQHALGAGAGEIAAIFGIAALAGVLVRPAFGRWSDRRGPLRPIRIGLLASAPVVLGVPWLDSRVAAAALTIAALVLTGVLWAPLMVMLSDACTAAGVGQIMAVVIIDLTWPPGNALGAAGGAAIAQAAGQRWAYATMAAALLGGYLALGRSRGQLAAEVQTPPA
jgi:DHA1 family solute carrier family 18 vesicular amine transporter 1/2